MKAPAARANLLGSIADDAKRFPSPDDYFTGIRWRDGFLPDNILCFHRNHPVDELAGYEGISERSGKFDQHHRFVLIVCLAEGGGVGVETNLFGLEEGDALLVFPHQLHYYVDLPGQFCWFYLTFELPPEATTRVASLRDRPRRLDKAALQLLREVMVACRRAGEDGGKIDAALKLRDFLLTLEAAPDATGGDTPGVEAGNSDAALVNKVKRFIYGHLDGDLGIAAIADHTGLSESYVRARFKEQVGISLGQFILAARITRAAHLLKTSTKKIAEVSRDCGFDSQLSFTRAFKRALHVTPRDYRK